MIKELSQYSKEMSAQILEEFPNWREQAGTNEHNGEKYFDLRVVPPSSNIESPLRIYTYQDELTISFDAYHAHFFEFKENDDEIKDDDAFSFIKRIISDSYAVVSYWRDDQWCGSTLLPEEEFPINNAEYPYANKIKIRSWSGRLDENIKCEAKN